MFAFLINDCAAVRLVTGCSPIMVDFSTGQTPMTATVRD